METLKDRINSALEASDLKNAAELARACNVSAASVSDWTTGRTTSLKGKTLVLAAKALNVSERWLASGKGPRERDAAPEPEVTVINQWPFDLVSWERFDRLSERHKGVVEGAVLSAVAQCEAAGNDKAA